MANLTPWDLATIPTLPPSVEVWALQHLPSAPVDWSGVVAAREGRLVVNLVVAEPSVNGQGTLASRTISLLVQGPRDAGQYPLQCVGFALVDGSQPGTMVGYFATPSPCVLNLTTDSYRLEATIIVARNGGANG